MSCGCKNREMAMQLERARRLAKALAKIEGENVYLYQRDDGSYGFDIKKNLSETDVNKVKETITRY